MTEIDVRKTLKKKLHVNFQKYKFWVLVTRHLPMRRYKWKTKATYGKMVQNLAWATGYNARLLKLKVFEVPS